MCLCQLTKSTHISTNWHLLRKKILFSLQLSSLKNIASSTQIWLLNLAEIFTFIYISLHFCSFFLDYLKAPLNVSLLQKWHFLSYNTKVNMLKLSASENFPFCGKHFQIFFGKKKSIITTALRLCLENLYFVLCNFANYFMTIKDPNYDNRLLSNYIFVWLLQKWLIYLSRQQYHETSI